MQIGDIVLSCYSNTKVDAIGVITGDYEMLNEDDVVKGPNNELYLRSRQVNWIIKYDKEEEMLDIRTLNDNKVMTLLAVYKFNSISTPDIMDIINKIHSTTPKTQKPSNLQNYVFIIDEINRGNISKIFGELITLIEDDKRDGEPEERSCRLPYSKQKFKVPSNVYILGTMNTADRSLTRLDTALRRRFVFEEMMPRPELFKDIIIDGINIEKLLTKMNERIEALYDREHQIGHAYFFPLKEENNRTIEKLGEIMRKKILPLLQEYFFDDWKKIQLVLGDNQKKKGEPEEPQFVVKEEKKASDLFGEGIEVDINPVYRINDDAFNDVNAYQYLGLEPTADVSSQTIPAGDSQQS